MMTIQCPRCGISIGEDELECPFCEFDLLSDDDPDDEDMEEEEEEDI